MPTTDTAAPAARAGPPAPEGGLRCRVRLADGRTFTGTLPPERHRALQLGMLHADTAQLVELTPGVRPPGGKVDIDRRRRPEHYLAGGASGNPGWLRGLLEHAERIVAGHYADRRFDDQVREEAFVGVTPRVRRRGNKDAVAASRFLWVDVDQPGQLPALWAFLAERPCHLLIESGGSGGAHAYWKLAEPLQATRLDQSTGELVEPIERAHLRIIHHLGEGDDGKPNVADVACFPAGSLILTDAGHVPIEQINVGDRVLTHMGRWRRVTAAMRRRADTVTVIGHGHPGLETTANHPFLSRTRAPRWDGGPFAIGNVEWTPADQLPGRFWATMTEIEGLPVPPVGGRGMEFTREFWWLVGRWLGDGRVRPRKLHTSRNGERSALLEICCGHAEREKLRTQLTTFEPPASRSFAGRGELRWMTRTQRTATVFFTCHDGLANWLVEHFGRGSLGKRLPAFVYGMPEQWRAALLAGYLSADGSAIKHRRQTSSVSKELSIGIRQLTETLGHRAGLYCYPQPTDTIEGRKVQTHDQWHVRWKVDPKYNYAFAEGRHAWLRVKGVSPGGKSVEVFNLTVEDDESYVVEGIVVHNCKERARVMRLAGTINYKTGAYARIVEADFHLAAYPIDALVGDLPDPRPPAPPARARRAIEHNDPYKRISPPEYFETLAGIDVPRGGLVSCPAPWHEDRHPSCSVGIDASQGWCCLAAETSVITDDGVRPIAELAGTTTRVLTTGGVWVAAPFRSFDTQRLSRIILSRSGREKEIFATAEHRWFVRTESKHRSKRELITRELTRGHRLVSVFPNRTPRTCNLNVSPFGVARGFTFGDGHRFRKGCRASFYGDKDAALLPYFPLSTPYHHAPTGSLVIGDLPGYFKALPDVTEQPSYLYGWLAGYFAADGDITDTTASLNCADGTVLERVRSICTRVGIGTYGISRYERRGIGGEISAIYRLRLMRGDLSPDFFVLPHHRTRFEHQQLAYERRDWIVTRVESTDRADEVFCATVPGTHTFALEDNILTGNCHSDRCGARGAIYDLASVLIGGPHGRDLRGEAFKRARAYVADSFGDLT